MGDEACGGMVAGCGFKPANEPTVEDDLFVGKLPLVETDNGWACGGGGGGVGEVRIALD